MLRTSLLSLLLASSAFAQATPAKLAPIALDDVPEQCTAIGKQANGATGALTARVSLANCLADTKLATLKLLDCEESVLAVDEATKQSFAILDSVIITGDAVTKILGEHAKAELYGQMIQRMRQTLSAPTSNEADVALLNVRKDLLEGLLAKWKTAAGEASERIVLAVKAMPALESHPIVATALRNAKDRLRQRVATAAEHPATKPDDTGEAVR